MCNTGTSDIALTANVIYVHSIDAAGWTARPQHWEKRAAVKLFNDHGWIEAHETIDDHLLIPIDHDDDVLAYQLECRAYERRKQGGGIKWTARAVIPVALKPLSAKDEPASQSRHVDGRPATVRKETAR